MTLPSLSAVKIGVIGLGYVGLPLAVCLAQRFSVVGFDINERRVDDLKRGVDRTREVTEEEITATKDLSLTKDAADLKPCNVYIVTVPTPIDAARQPDLTACRKASAIVGGVISKGNVVIYESTVYPGATEEVCVPIIERTSGLKCNRDFFAGYSPERINPGDPTRRISDIRKITSGSTPEAAELVDAIYASVITAGTHRASAIRVAEAAKVIENVQRDLNIALVNELAQLFKRLGIETREVLEAAGTKWNFHGYRPGLVGGHCVGVDPYYLTHKAQSIGFHPEVILAGRRVNDEMASYVAYDILKTMVKHHLSVGDVKLLVMGFTFKENCPDSRNTKVSELVRELQQFASSVEIWDPHADPDEVSHEYGLTIQSTLPDQKYDGIVLAVRHDEIAALGVERLRAMLSSNMGFIYDVKGILSVAESDARL